MQSRKAVLATSLAMILSLGVASGAAAIGDDEDPAVTFCQSAGALSQAVESMASLDASATTDELQAATDAVRDAASATVDARRDLLEAQADAIDAAVGDLQDYIGDVAGDQTVEEAVAGAIPYVQEVLSARAALGSVDCAAAMAGQAVEDAGE